jgi:single-strand DNA-binding protein
MNSWHGIGRLVRDVELKATQTGMSIVKFTVAIDRRAKQGEDKKADFISCVAFGKTADFIAKYFSKGSKIVIIGRIQTGSYDDKDGKKIYTTDIMVDEVEFAESKQNNNNGDYSNISADYKPAPGINNLPEGFTVIDDTELPFDLGI